MRRDEVEMNDDLHDSEVFFLYFRFYVSFPFSSPVAQAD